MSTAAAEPNIVRKAGEGYGRPNADAELPIDINYQKLSEWLVQRQKLPSDWHKRLQAIQAKITEAAKDLPAGLLAGLPGGADAAVDYFRAVEIRDKLAQTGERTLFGGLTGQAGVWDKIVKAYENGCVFIGEAAQTMVQNVDYEIPYLRKQMTKCNQQMADADRRHAEYTRSAETAANNYKKECEKLGITGTAVGRELKQLTSKLPTLFEQLVEDLRSPDLNNTIQYYQHFTQYAHSSSSASKPGQQQQLGQEQQLPEVLQVLTEIKEHRTTPYAAEAATSAAANNAAGSAGISIDWGGLMDAGTAGDSTTAAASAAPTGIDWGLGGGDSATAAAGDSNAAGGGISWDLGDAATAGGISLDIAVEPAAADAVTAPEAAGAGGPTLDWDIDLSGIGVESAGDSATAAAAPGINWDIEVDSGAAPTAGDAHAGPAAEGAAANGAAGASTSSSSDASAGRLQHDSDYRSQLQDDLQELRAFLVSRRSELSGSSSSSNLLRALAPDVVSSTDVADVRKMLQQVEQLLARLNDDKLKQLLMISSSSRYLERLQGSLQRKAGQEAKLLAAAAETQARKHEARATLVGLQPKLSEVVEHTRSIKKSVEAALSKQFNSRRVNVLGEINNALSASA